jgi:hypothetical protein
VQKEERSENIMSGFAADQNQAVIPQTGTLFPRGAGRLRSIGAGFPALESSARSLAGT